MTSRSGDERLRCVPRTGLHASGEAHRTADRAGTTARAGSGRASDLALLGGRPVFAGRWPRWPQLATGAVEAVVDVLNSERWTITSRAGSEVAVERTCAAEFARYVGTSHCVLSDHGSSALGLALQALDLRPGAEVVVPAVSWVASATAVVMSNAIPVFADVDSQTGCVTPATVDQVISDRTEAVVLVHPYRTMADAETIAARCAQRGIPVIEDAAQAHGAQWRGRNAGTFGAMGVFSFQQAKVLTCGEGGAVVTNDDGLADRLVQLRTDGRAYRSSVIPGEMEVVDGESCFGTNFCLTAIQAALLSAQLASLDELLDRQARAERMLDDGLAGLGVDTIVVAPEITRHSVYKYGFKWPWRGWMDIPIETVLAALRAELDLPIHAADPPLPRFSLYRPWVQRRLSLSPEHHERLKGSAEASVPGGDEFCERLCLIHHSALLADGRHIDAILTAVEKILGSYDVLASAPPVTRTTERD